MKNIPESAKRTFLVHTVKKGETVTKIAKKYGVSKNDLADANNISTKTKLSAGVLVKNSCSTILNVMISPIIQYRNRIGFEYSTW